MEKKKRNQLWRLPFLILSLVVLAYSIAFMFWGLIPSVGKIQFFAETNINYIIPGWPQAISLPFIYWIIWNVIFVIISTSVIVLLFYYLRKKTTSGKLLIWKFGLTIGISVGLIMLFATDVVVGAIFTAVIWFSFRKNKAFLGSMTFGLIAALILGFLFGFIYSVLLILISIIGLGLFLALQALAQSKVVKRIGNWVEGN